jgi:hypothetical protein
MEHSRRKEESSRSTTQRKIVAYFNGIMEKVDAKREKKRNKEKQWEE